VRRERDGGEGEERETVRGEEKREKDFFRNAEEEAVVCVALLYFVIFTRWAAGGAHSVGSLTDTWVRMDGPAGRRQVGAWRYLFARARLGAGEIASWRW
jgi:hypothetical protein